MTKPAAYSAKSSPPPPTSRSSTTTCTCASTHCQHPDAPAHSPALSDELTNTRTVYPGTDLTLIYTVKTHPTLQPL